MQVGRQGCQIGQTEPQRHGQDRQDRAELYPPCPGLWRCDVPAPAGADERGACALAACAVNRRTNRAGTSTALNEIASGQLNLMPVPASVQRQPSRLPINGSFKVAVKNYTDDRLRAGIGRMLTRLAGRTVLTLPAGFTADESTATLVVQCERAGDIVPSVNENESYNLDVTNKQARLSAPTVSSSRCPQRAQRNTSRAAIRFGVLGPAGS